MLKCLVQFDGSNFYNKVKRIIPSVHLTNFDYAGLSTEIVGRDQEVKINYYVGEIKQYNNQPRSKDLFVGQQKLFHRLKSQDVEIRLGYLLFSDGKFHEKGVDVQIAVDMVRGSLKNEFDDFYLISSDTDLLPAIQIAREEGKKVVYVGFENFVSQALSRNCSSYLILKKDQLLKYARGTV